MIPTPPGILTDDEYEQIMGAGGPAAAPESERSFWLAQVNQYRAFRVSAPREKDLEAQRQRLSRLDALALDPDGEAKRLQLDTILTAAPEQQAAAKDALLIDSMLAERASRRVNISGSVWDANKPPSVLAADRDAARDALAVEMFGETAPRGSDAAVAGKLREAAGERQKLRWIIAGRDPAPDEPGLFSFGKKDDTETKAINEASLARNAWRAGLAGIPVAEAFAAWKEAARKSPAWSPAAEKFDFFQKFRSMHHQADFKAAPYREKVRSVVENILKASRAEGDGAASMLGAAAGIGGGGVLSIADETARLMEAMAPLEDMDPETLRGSVMPIVRALAETRKDPDGRDMWDKIVASFRRPIARSLGASWDILSSLTSTAGGHRVRHRPDSHLSEDRGREAGRASRLRRGRIPWLHGDHRNPLRRHGHDRRVIRRPEPCQPAQQQSHDEGGRRWRAGMGCRTRAGRTGEDSADGTDREASRIQQGHERTGRTRREPARPVRHLRSRGHRSRVHD
jgi:hypothetical protein